MGDALPVLLVAHFVAANVDDSPRKEGGQLRHHVPDKLVGALAGGVKGRSVIEADGNLRQGTRRKLQLRIGDDGCGGMAGHVYLGHDGDIALRRITHNAPDLLLRIKAFMGFPGILAAPPGFHFRILPFAAHGRQLGVLPDLDAPSRIIGQMPMQDIHLQQPHLGDQLLNLFLAEKMPRLVQHKGPP